MADDMKDINRQVFMDLLGEISNALTNIHIELKQIRELMEK